MSYTIKQIRLKFFELVPIFILFFITLNGKSVIDFKILSINVHYILIYYWVLRQPQALGYGFRCGSSVCESCNCKNISCE